MDLDNVERTERSEFSMDFSLFWRLGNIQFWADTESKNLDVYNWFNTLLVLYREIAPLMKPEKRELFEKKISDLIPLFNDIKKQIIEKDSFKVDYDLYKKLQDLEIELKLVMVEKGIYLKRKDDSSFGVR